MEKSLMRISDEDNVAIALNDLNKGEKHKVNNIKVEIKENIPFGHKVAICDINSSENIIKYGYPIGNAKLDIKKGEHIHTHNLRTNLDGLLEYSYNNNYLCNNKKKRIFF